MTGTIVPSHKVSLRYQRPRRIAAEAFSNMSGQLGRQKSKLDGISRIEGRESPFPLVDAQ